MKKPDRQPRARIPRTTKPADGATEGKIDPWRDAPKEEILARGKKAAGPSAPGERAKKKDFVAGEKKGRPGTGDKKTFRAERADDRGESGSRNDRPRRDARAGREERSDFKKPAFKKDDSRAPRRNDERDGRTKPRKLAKGFGEEVKGERGEKKPFARRDDDRREDTRSSRGEKPFSRKPQQSDERSGNDRNRNDRPQRGEKSFSRSPRPDDGGDARGRKESARGEKPFAKKPRRDDDRDSRGKRDERPARDFKKERTSAKQKETESAAPTSTSDAMTLNKYLAHAGVSSRRDAATVIKEGKVKVNGEVLLTPGYRVQPGDKVTFEGKAMKPEVKKVYVLLNKPKGFITTTDDEMDRRTVMELVQAVEVERLYPVGRLDRNTTGLLLMTNDGDLAQRLTHPKYEAKKIYQVGLDKPLTKADFERLLGGVELEDGVAKPDKLSFLETPSELGIEIHSGRNRIVRRMFEALGYEVEKLDRVMFAGLTKKNIPRGQWRHLTEQEVVRLKHFKS